MQTSRQSYPHLFQPLTLAGGVTLKNRLLMGSMHTGLEEKSDCFARMAAFYQARAAGGVGLIVTGGIAPNREARLIAHSMRLDEAAQVAGHRLITEAVHAAGGKINVQILHAGRYSAHNNCVAPSAIRSPISPYKPRQLTAAEIEQTIADYIRTALLAEEAGYDGVEVMGSEGYLINQFLAPRVNKRQDEWGGGFAGRSRFALRIVQGIRRAVAARFIVGFRLSLIDLVEDGSTWAETLELARLLEQSGLDLLNTGIGWHEAQLPTIAGVAPQAAFAEVCRQLKKSLTIPVVCSNRINMPETAERILADSCADMVSMARPFLADPDWPIKAENAQAKRINTCVACNQGCLDHLFSGKTVTCLVNPRAGHETTRPLTKTRTPKHIAVVGGGPAGLACAVTAAMRGHRVTLFEKSGEIGGQLRLAMLVPGKREFAEIIRYYQEMLAASGVEVRLAHEVSVEELQGFDERVIACGARPRPIDIPGADFPLVMNYAELLSGQKIVGQRVAIIGAGVIAFDCALWLLGAEKKTLTPEEFFQRWGIEAASARPGGLGQVAPIAPTREIHMLHRSPDKPGAGLGKTTGWIHRAELKRGGVRFHSGVTYQYIDADGLWIIEDGAQRHIAVDSVLLCAGQVAENTVADELHRRGLSHHLIGGSKEAAGLDALKAIDEGVALADAL
ncbi:MAG: FAD-dependent oxidoreductase [Desulfobulbaceae bacterium]|nr:FAD-dependent oxidoreductase [Desulfobulbaceae bacterium]